MLGALIVVVEDDVGDLLVGSVGLAGDLGNGLDGDGLAESVFLAGLVEGGLAIAELGDDLVRGQTRGWGGVEGAEARCVTLGGGGGGGS